MSSIGTHLKWWVYCSNKLCVYAAGYYPPMAALNVTTLPSSQDVIFITRPEFPWFGLSLSLSSYFFLCHALFCLLPLLCLRRLKTPFCLFCLSCYEGVAEHLIMCINHSLMRQYRYVIENISQKGIQFDFFEINTVTQQGCIKLI